jgi:hypothetical protein
VVAEVEGQVELQLAEQVVLVEVVHIKLLEVRELITKVLQALMVSLVKLLAAEAVVVRALLVLHLFTQELMVMVVTELP